MLKFAERFLVNNPGVFANAGASPLAPMRPSSVPAEQAFRVLSPLPLSRASTADTAYVLAYSTIMLNVDQHNPQVKKRMTKQEFIKNNRGINNNQDLPEQILSDIFDDIAANELRLKDDTDKPVDLAVITHSKNKKAAFLQQSQEILKRTQALFKERQKAHTQVTFYSASRVEHVKPMFESVWMSLLVTFSGPMQETEVRAGRRGRPQRCPGPEAHRSARHVVCM